MSYMSSSPLAMIGLGNLTKYPAAQVYMVLGVWTVALVFATVALVKTDESQSEKQRRVNLYGALTLFCLIATFYFALQLL